MQQFSLECLNAVQYRGDLGDKKTEYNRYNNELNTISKHYAEMSEMGLEIAKCKGAFKVDVFFGSLCGCSSTSTTLQPFVLAVGTSIVPNDKRTKSVNQFWEVQDVARMAEEKSRAEVRMLQASQHVTIATVTTEQVQQYARATTTKILEKFLDEKEKSPDDESEDDGVHVYSGEFPNSSLLGRNDTKDALETIVDAENPLFVSEHDSNDATVNQDELVPLKNTHKRLFSEIGDDLPSSHIMSVMEKYRAKSTTSKYESNPSSTNPVIMEDWKKILYWVERAVGTFLDAFESEYNPIQQNDCGEREWFGEYVIPIFSGGEVTVVASCRRRNENKNILEEYLERGHLADLLCKIDQQEVVCGLACGGPHKYDLTKWASDEYQLPRMLKDTLDDILEKFRGASRDSSNLYTIEFRDSNIHDGKALYLPTSSPEVV
ncbi:7683_t:CDS:10 [Funneliformis geosporum]|uniref:7683_t:CDS:1 n=1 Tax=Funneliformis geosporum TaxID=1117311 RepID=A0A9W4SP30_9GLOM|nr:7683_t:CDS:10 [Funneliformis geosporum]